MAEISKISLLIFSVLICLGGVVGFLKAKSKASLISGVVGGALLSIAYSVSERNIHQGLLLGAFLTAVLAVVFAIRLRKTKKFMPAGLLLTFCAVELVLLFLGISNPTA